MTGITHKQARRYINTLVDSIIKEQEQRLLDDHLKICGECRSYSAHLNTLESSLKQSFHQRWDNSNGPSEKLVQNVQSQISRIIMTNRINLGLRTLAGLIALVVLGILISSVFRLLRNSSVVANTTQTVVSSSKSNWLIAFVSTQDGNSEIYMMNADGSDAMDITNNRAYDGNPVWSPDGSKIAFESDRDGNLDIFVMNADGSGLTQLTRDPANDILGASPRAQDFGVKVPDIWSPDGSHILFSNDRSGKWIPYVMNVDGSGATQLTQANDPPMGGIRWSPDGKQVAYSLGAANGWGQIIAVNIDGTNRREIATGDPAKGDNVWQTVDLIGWSQDEQFIYYEYQTGSGTWYILKVAANGTNSSQEIASGYALVQGLYVSGWLGSDSVLSYTVEAQGASHGSRLQNTQNGKSIFWDSFVICGYSLPNSSQNSFNGALPITNWAVSKTGSQLVLGVSCSNKGYSEIYSLDSTTSAFDKIAKIPIVWSEIKVSWSADNQLVLIEGTDKLGKTKIYLLNAEDLQKKSLITPTLICSGENIKAFLQPVPFNGLPTAPPLSGVPMEQSTGSAPLWNGDSRGDLIAFASDRTGNADIYIAKSDGSGVTNLTHRSANDSSPVWSPDGNWIAFASGFNGNYSLHIMRPDGSSEKKIADTWWNFIWSQDSKKIAYLVILPDNPSDPYSPAKISLKIIDLDGNILQITNLGVFNQAGQLRWSQDGQSLSYVASQMISTPTGEMKTTESDLFQLRLESKSPILLIQSDKPIDAWTGTESDLTYLVRNINEWDLFQRNGSKQKKLTTWGFDEIQCGTGADPTGHFTWNYGSETAIKNWSPDGKYISFQITCDDGKTWLYLGGIDGKFFKLSNYPVQDVSSWSSDSKNILFVSDLGAAGNLDIYKLNVDSVIQNPSVPPIRLTTSGFDEYSPVGQPQP